MNKLLRMSAVFALGLLAAGCLEQEATQIRVENAWIPEIPPLIHVAAGYMEIINGSNSTRYLVGASSSRASSVQIHRSTIVNEMARMERQSEVALPAGDTLVFSNETGYHLMFYDAEGYSAGTRIPVTLEFKDGSTLSAEFEVVDRRKLD